MVALFYFSGYGIQVARQTYLIPVNAQVWTEAEVRRDGISLDALLAEMQRKGAKVKIVIIDASRRNPFERRFRASAAGLAALDAPDGTLAMYSAAPGKVINEGSGPNSLFVGELIKELRVPNLTAEEVFNRARIGVSRASNNEQVPWVASSLIDEFYFGSPRPVATGPAAAPTPSPAPTPPRTAAPAPAPAPSAAPAPAPAPAPSATATLSTTSPPTATGAKAGDVFRDCQGCVEMLVVPAGSFDMGSATEYENPAHRVTIAKPFAIGRHEVTFDQWDMCVADGAASIAPRIGNGDEATVRSSMSAGSMRRPSWLGFRKKRDRLIGCRAKPNGNMPPEVGRTPPIGGAATWAPARRTAGSAIPALLNKRRRSVRIRRTPMVFTTPQATRRSGWRIAGTIIIAARPRMVRRGSRDSVGFGCCGEARSTARLNICVRRPASGMIPTCDIRPTDFGSRVTCNNAVKGHHGPDIRVSSMRPLGPVVVAAAKATLVGAIILIAAPPAGLLAAEINSPSAVQVSVVRATSACFSSTIRVTGFLVAREEAIVTLDAPGVRVTEVLVGEGDRVTAGQTLVRLARQGGDGQDAAAVGRSTTTILKSPVAGVVTRSTAVVGATASPMNEPLFRIAVDNEIELEAEVPSIHAGALSPGQTVRVLIEDSRELSGRVRQAPAAVDQRTQLGRARLSLERESRAAPRNVRPRDHRCGP